MSGLGCAFFGTHALASPQGFHNFYMKPASAWEGLLAWQQSSRENPPRRQRQHRRRLRAGCHQRCRSRSRPARRASPTAPRPGAGLGTCWPARPPPTLCCRPPTPTRLVARFSVAAQSLCPNLHLLPRCTPPRFAASLAHRLVTPPATLPCAEGPEEQLEGVWCGVDRRGRAHGVERRSESCKPSSLNGQGSVPGRAPAQLHAPLLTVPIPSPPAAAPGPEAGRGAGLRRGPGRHRRAVLVEGLQGRQQFRGGGARRTCSRRVSEAGGRSRGGLGRS